MKYAIQADYWMWSEELGEHTEPEYLGLEGKYKIFVFEEEVTERTKLFDTAKEAGEYVDKHFNPEKRETMVSFDTVRIVEVKRG